MNYEAIRHLARLVTELGKVVDFKNNSVFGLTMQGNDDNLKQIAKIIASKVNNDLGMVRNTYIPFITYFSSIVEEIIKNRGSIDSIKEYNIKEITKPNFYNILKEKGRFDNELINPQLPLSGISVLLPKDAKVKDFIKTGIPSYDIEIESLLTGYTDESLTNIWERFFYNIAQDNTTLTDLTINNQKYIKDIIIVYAAILNMIDNKPSSVTTNDETFKNIMYVYRDKIQYYLKEIDKSYNISVTQGRLVIKLEPKTVFVNGDVYKQFLSEAENTPEIIFGMLVSENVNFSSFYMKDIGLRKQEYINNWDSKAKRTAVAAGLEEVRHYRLAYEMAIRKVMGNLNTDNSIPDDIKKEITKTTLEIVDGYKDYINDKDIAGLRDVFEVSRVIVTGMMLSGTNAYRITNYINDYKHANPNITIQNAATFSSVDLILDYLLEQVDVRGLNG